MAILPGNLKTYRSDTMTDASDNGGEIGSVEVVSGELHNVFNDISSGDRNTGAVRMRKLYHKITSQDRSVFLKARSILTKLPLDTTVDVTLFYTGDQHDREVDAKKSIEAYRVKGAKHQAHLWETQYKGTPSVSIFMDDAVGSPEVGDIMYLTQFNDTESQYIRVTSVEFREQSFYVGNTGASKVTKTIIVLGTSERLKYTFLGATVSVPQTTPQAIMHESILADSAQYYSTRPLKITANTDDTKVTAYSVYSQLLPNSLREESFIDVNPLGDRTAVAESTFGIIDRTVVTPLISGTVLELNTPIEYGSLSISGSVTALTDANNLVDQSGVVIATINHKNGTITFTNTVGVYGTKVVTFKPGILEEGQPFTALLEVSNANLGSLYTINLAPSLVPGSVEVSYAHLGKWYTLYDNGSGTLKALRDGIGSGTINYGTKSVSLNLSAIPDVGSGIIFSWLGYTDTKPLPSLANTVAKVKIELPTYVNSNTQDVVITWPGSTATLSGTLLTGAATGALIGKTLEVVPTVLMAPGTLITVTATAKIVNPPAPDIEHRNSMRELEPDHTPSSNNGTLLSGAFSNTKDISPHSVRIRYVASIATAEQWTYGGVSIPASYRTNNTTITVYVVDDGSGNLVFNHDKSTSVGTINYVTGAYSFTALISKESLTVDSVQLNRPHFITATQTTNLVGASRTAILPKDLMLPNGDKIHASWSVDMGLTSVLPAQVVMPESFIHSHTVSEVEFAINVPMYAEIGRNTLFTLGNRHYSTSDVGALQYVVNLGDVPQNTGAVLLTERAVVLTDWSASNNLVVLEAVNVSRGKAITIKELVLRTLITPNRPESFTIRGETVNDVAFSVTSTANGLINDPLVVGTIVDEYGLVKLEFTQPIKANSLRYNTTSQELITLPSDIVGLETVRLPSDGRVRVFSKGNTVVIFNEVDESGNYSNNSQLDLQRTDIKVLVVKDSTGAVVPGTAYTADLAAGTIDWGDLTNVSKPISVLHRIENERIVESVQLTGDIKLDKPLVGTFPLDESFIASAARYGDLVSKVSTPFTQKTWTDEWASERIGALILPKYDDSSYPILVTNDSAYSSQYLILFKSNTLVDVISKTRGVLLEDVSILSPISPINPDTGFPIFIMSSSGWGGGWTPGNCLRFEVEGAYDNVWAIQSIAKEEPTDTTPEALIACVELRGDINT